MSVSEAIDTERSFPTEHGVCQDAIVPNTEEPMFDKGHPVTCDATPSDNFPKGNISLIDSMMNELTLHDSSNMMSPTENGVSNSAVATSLESASPTKQADEQADIPKLDSIQDDSVQTLPPNPVAGETKNVEEVELEVHNAAAPLIPDPLPEAEAAQVGGEAQSDNQLSHELKHEVEGTAATGDGHQTTVVADRPPVEPTASQGDVSPASEAGAEAELTGVPVNTAEAASVTAAGELSNGKHGKPPRKSAESNAKPKTPTVAQRQLPSATKQEDNASGTKPGLVAASKTTAKARGGIAKMVPPTSRPGDRFKVTAVSKMAPPRSGPISSARAGVAVTSIPTVAPKTTTTTSATAAAAAATRTTKIATATASANRLSTKSAPLRPPLAAARFAPKPQQPEQQTGSSTRTKASPDRSAPPAPNASANKTTRPSSLRPVAAAGGAAAAASKASAAAVVSAPPCPSARKVSSTQPPANAHPPTAASNRVAAARAAAAAAARAARAASKGGQSASGAAGDAVKPKPTPTTKAASACAAPKLSTVQATECDEEQAQKGTENEASSSPVPPLDNGGDNEAVAVELRPSDAENASAESLPRSASSETKGFKDSGIPIIATEHAPQGSSL